MVLVVPPPGVGEKTVMSAVPTLAMSAAVIAAFNCVPETKVVTRSAPLSRTFDALTKFVPLTIKVKAAPPTITGAGLMLVKVGSGLVWIIVKSSSADNPPPTAGLKTLTFAVPAFTTSVAGITAVTCVAETKVVTRSAPFQRMTAPLTKLLPLTASVNWLLPEAMELGARLVATGTGFGGIIVKVADEVVPPPGSGLKTVTAAEPALRMSAAVIAACNCVALTNVVTRSVPFQRTMELLLKFVPLTVSVKAADVANIEVGLMLVRVGNGLLTAIVTDEPGAEITSATSSPPSTTLEGTGLFANVTCVVTPTFLMSNVTVKSWRTPAANV